MDGLLMYEIQFEDPEPEPAKPYVPPLFSVFMCEETVGKGEECPNEATGEWVNFSEYNDPQESNPSGYYTYRCDDHPVKDREYEWRPL